MKTIVGLFDRMEQAQKAAMDLENAGVPRDDISLVANNEGGRYAAGSDSSDSTESSGHAIGHDAAVGAEIGGAAGLLIGLTSLAIPGLGWIAGAGWLMGLVLGAGTGAIVGGLVGALTHVGVPNEDASHFTEGVRRGGILIAVKAQDDAATRVARILSDDGAVNIDERAAQYRQEGFTPTGTGTSTSTRDVQNETVLPVVEEQLNVGKREVQSGGVRVYTHITETPVEENVRLREEHVTIERNPVNRPATSADTSGLRDQTIEVLETSEQPVVAKQARVVEEVVVGKEASERTETVRDTLRHTDVDVEDLSDEPQPVNSRRS